MRYFITALALLLSACDADTDSSAKPKSLALPADAVGYFCNMTVSLHNGPKGQIFLRGQKDPIWFVSVRDTLAFTRLPEEAHKVQAIYVTDMGVAQNWDQPENNSWREADNVWFVVDSKAKGGMGSSEIVPFSDKEKAMAFIATNGGKLLKISDIDTISLLGSSDDTDDKKTEM